MEPDKLFMKIINAPIRLKWTFFSTIFVGMLSHGFVFTNKLPNSDDLMNIRAYGGGISHGCWLKGLMGPVISKFTGNYTNPWIIGVTSVILIAAAACFIVEALEIKSIAAAGMTGAIIVSFPALTGSFLFMYMSAYFALAVLMISCGIWLLATKKRWMHMAAGVFLVSCATGIYQAYFPLAAGLLLLSLIRKCMCESDAAREIVKKALAYLGYLAAAMGGYFLLLKLCLTVFHETMGAHKGLDKIGQIDIASIPGIVVRMYGNMLGMLRGDYMGMSADLVIRILIGISWAGAGIFAVYKTIVLIREKQWGKMAMGWFFLLIFPIAINLIDIMVGGTQGQIYILMEYALCLIFILPIALWDTYAKPAARWCILAAGGMIAFYYVNLANEAYILAELSQRSVESFYTTVITQIKMQAGYRDDLEVVFVGYAEDPTLYPLGDEFSNLNLGSDIDTVSRVNQTREGLLKYYCGFYPEYAGTYDKAAEETVAQMPCYPDDGSIRIIGGQVIVKFSEG